jgi:DNA mismatch repair ATPase MutL
MNNRIKLLPELIINQIAAGEVIERPASIVKELLENSIDANSSLIRVYIEQGGISAIKIVDDGTGIHPDDILLVFTQHATSKITNIVDLDTIQSLGFRGEALASINAVAKVKLISQQQEPHGTTVEVRELFYNVPARKKFLRSATTEFNHLQEVFKRIALSNYQIGFMLYHNNKLVKNLPAITDKEQRLAKVLGKRFIDQAVFFEISANSMNLSGWVATDSDVSSSAIQYFYINNRMVRDRLLNAAVKQATQELAISPAYCLYLQLDPSWFDINVHPSKQEVRFANPTIIYTLIKDGILEALTQAKATDNIDDIDYRSSANNMDNADNISNTLSSSPTNFNNINNYDPERQFWLQEYNSNPSTNVNPNFNTNINPDIEADSLPVSPSVFPPEKFNINNNFQNTELKLFAIFDNRYIIGEQVVDGNKKIMLVNVAAGLTWLLHKKLTDYAAINIKQLIIPERIKLSYLPDNIEHYIQYLEKLQFIITQIHEDTLLITAIPDIFEQFNITINYQDFLAKILQIKSPDVNRVIIIDMLLSSIVFSSLSLYNKQDLTKLINNLDIENFTFKFIDEQQLSRLIT